MTFSGLANPFIQGYKYVDPLDRIIEAKETVNGTQTWIQNWGYDRYGNRSSFSQNIFGYTSVSNPTISTTTNRFTSGGFTFDKNGNVTFDHNGYEFTYDGNNKQTQAILSTQKGGVVTLGTYYYDGEGKRVKKTTHTSDNVIFVYSNGKLVEERNASTNALQTSYIYAGSQLLATETSSGTNYTATDQLGSPRVITNGSGSVVSRRDFLPFGEELFADGTYRKTSDNYTSTGSDIVRQRFTGYQRDIETGLDFAEARMYQNQHGRFTAVDPLLASGKSADPQTFNRYVYCINNPGILVDPTGLQSGKRVYVGTVNGSNHYTVRSSRPSGYKPVTSERRVNGDDGFVYRVTSRSIIGVGKWDRNVSTPSQGIDTSVTSPGQDNTRALINELGARSEGSMHMIGALVVGGTVGGLAAVPAATIGGATLLGTVVGEALLAEQAIRQGNGADQQTAIMGNTNPFQGPVSQPVTAVDDAGNAIRVGTGQQLTGSPDGQYIQVRDENGTATGVRKDGPHNDHAKFPHAHVPGVSNPDGSEHLKIRIRPR